MNGQELSHASRPDRRVATQAAGPAPQCGETKGWDSSNAMPDFRSNARHSSKFRLRWCSARVRIWIFTIASIEGLMLNARTPLGTRTSGLAGPSHQDEFALSSCTISASRAMGRSSKRKCEHGSPIAAEPVLQLGWDVSRRSLVAQMQWTKLAVQLRDGGRYRI